MTFRVNLRSNVRAVARETLAYKSREWPKAVRNALNDTAFNVRTRVVTRTGPRAFRLRNRGFLRAVFRVAKASVTKLRAAVYDTKGLDYLVLQAKGGVKRARRGRLAVPKDVRRGARGVVKSQRPAQLLARPNAFLAEGRGSHEVLFQEVGGRLRYRFTLVPQARIPKRFAFFEDAERTTRNAFPHHLEREARFAERRAFRRTSRSPL